MRYLKYIILSLLTSILTLSCVKELEDPTPIQQNAALTLVPRVKSFSNQYVTKAYTSEEAKITRLAILVFDENGNLIHLQEGSDDAGINSLPLNKSILNKPSATVVMFANVNLSNIRNASGKSILDNQSGLNIRDLPGYAFHFDSDKTVITDLGSSFKGFPMAGIRENVNLSPTATQQGAVDVSLQILYAKVNFEIGVENGNENTGTGMKFAMTGYSIHNVSTQMSLTAPEGATDESAEYSYASATGKAVNKSGTVALNGTPLRFTFYVAESRYEHNSDLTGIYPSDDWLASVEEEDVKNYDRLTDEAKLNGVKYFYDDLIQQYKPKLANVEGGSPGQGLATYVLLKGTYTDYRGTVWTVNYKVYLGKDNALNFHVDRNSEYTNYITIKGIRNNDGFGDEDVWLDHRVTNVSTTDPSGYISITRETLIDAHIEVRPMRVKWKEGEYAGVRVYLPTKDGTLVNWIGIERFTGANCQDSATYCYADGESTGKRRYFTTDLISELQTKEGEFGVQEDTDGRQFIYLQNGDCAWIYFDEHVSFTNSTTPSSARDAVIKLEFFGDDGNKKAEEIYNVKQLGLQRRGGYNVESYEEYLHSYDSADKYNLSTTPADYTQQGLAWGLADKVVSQDIIVSRATIGTDIIKDLADSWFPDAKYDFFADGDSDLLGDSFYRYMKENGVWSSKSGDKETGLGFTNRATKNKIITVKDMGSAPENAYQYCLSKNKFEVDDDGNVKMVLNWYLPDVHQLAKVLNATAEGSSDFRSGDYYWSSQPSFTAENTYEWGTTSIGLLDEVPEKARARSKGGNPKDFPRSSKNRIRCLYATKGQEADMTGRTPDGIGGIVSVIMKGHDNSNYFNYMVSPLESHPGPADPDDHDYQYNNNTYPWPTFANPGTDFGFLNNVAGPNNTTITGFSEDPASKSNWSPYESSLTDDLYYYTLYTFSGLSPYQTENARLANASKETTNLKQDTKIETTTKVIELEKNLHSSADELKPLDKDKKLNITFDIRDNSKSNYPQFKYYANTDGSKRVTTTKHWRVPTYPKVSLDPENPFSDTKDYEATVKKQYSLSNILTVETQAKTEALDAAIKKAKDEYPGAIYSIGTPSYKTERSQEGSWFNTKYYVEVTCTVEVTVSNYYYQDATNGGWYIADEKTESLDGVETDELRIYGGNSFTISLSDNKDENGLKYSEAYEITKVKVYYSGSNQISSTPEWGSTTTYLARFVDSETAANLPKAGEESDYMMGVEYSESDGWQQWSGTGCESVTLVLADYKVVSSLDLGGIFSGGNLIKYTYTYQKAAADLSKHLVIDRIEVKCTKKATASE